MSNEKTQINLREYWGVMVRRKTILILPLLIIPLVSIAVSYFLKPQYVSSVTILTGETNVLPPSVERELQGGAQRYDWVQPQERQISISSKITSTKYLRRLIAVLDLKATPQIMQTVSEVRATFPDVSEPDLIENIMADQLRNNITVNLRSSNLFEIQFLAADPLLAQKLAKSLADIFIEENLAQDMAGIRSNISFSEEQLAVYHEKLKDAEDKLKNYREGILATSVGEDTTGASLRMIISAAEALDLEIRKEEESQDSVRLYLVNNKIDLANLSLAENLQSEKARLINLLSTLTELLIRNSWRDPKVVNLNEEAKSLHELITQKIGIFTENQYANKSPQIRDKISEYLIGTVSLEYSRAKKEALDKSVGKIKSRITKNPDTEVTIQRLQSEVNTYRDLYNTFVMHSQYGAIDQSAKKVEAEAKFMIIKPASLPLTPESPNRRKLALMGIILALAIGMGSIIIVELLDNSFKRIEDAENYLHVTVIGTIPKVQLPYYSPIKKRIPIIIGSGISFILILFIIYLKIRKSG